VNANLRNNVIFLTLLQAANYVSPLLLIPYLLRVLGSAEYGTIAVILGMVQACYIITEFGFSQSATAKIAQRVNKIFYVSLINGAVVAIKLMICTLCSIVACIAIYYQGYGGFDVLISVISIIFFQALQPVWFFNGIEKMGRISIFLIASKIFYCILTVLLVNTTHKYESAIYSMAVSSFLGLVISLWFFYKTPYRIVYPGHKIIKKEFLYSLRFFWARGAVSLYTSLCVVFVGGFAGMQQASLFSVCEQIFKAGKLVMSPLCQALYPYLIRTNNWKVFFKLFTITAVTMFIGCGVVITISKDILQLIFNIYSSEANHVLTILVIGVYASYLSVYFGYLALVPLNKANIANNSVIFGAFAFFIVGSIVYIFGEISAVSVAYIILMTETIIASIRICAFILAYNKVKAKSYE